LRHRDGRIEPRKPSGDLTFEDVPRDEAEAYINADFWESLGFYEEAVVLRRSFRIEESHLLE
jgi:hypothetical protein